MSFVSVVAREKFISVMSDGRVVDLNTQKVKQEDYKKFISIDNNAFVAYTGIKELCEMVATNIEKSIRKGLEFSEILVVIRIAVAQFIQKQHTVMFAFGGINKNNQVEVFSYNSRDESTNHFLPKGDEIAYVFLSNGSTAESMLEEKFKSILRETGIDSPSSFVQAQKLLNRYVASIDPTVNNNTFRLIIKK